MMSPMQIQWCLVFWTRGDPISELGFDHYNSSAGVRVLNWMIDNALIDAETHRSTEKLGAFVEHLCAQPLPVQTWIIPPAPLSQGGHAVTPLLTPEEVCERLGKTKPELMALVEGGSLRALRISSRTLRFQQEDVEQYLNPRPIQPPRAPRVRQPRKPKVVQQVYFVQMRRSLHVKIGVAKNLKKRMEALRCGNPEPLKVIFTTPGDFDIERRIHRAMTPWHLEGEWYAWNSRMAEAIERFRTTKHQRDVLAWLYLFEDADWKAELGLTE